MSSDRHRQQDQPQAVNAGAPLALQDCLVLSSSKPATIVCNPGLTSVASTSQLFRHFFAIIHFSMIWLAHTAYAAASIWNNLHSCLVRHGRPAQDYMGKPIAVGDIVDLQDGKLKGRGGTVKYVVRGMLFLHVRCAPSCSG